MLSAQTSTSTSGGGVGGSTKSALPVRTPATSPTKATPLSRSKKLTWWEACPGVWTTSKARSAAAIRSPPASARTLASGTGRNGPQSVSSASP